MSMMDFQEDESFWYNLHLLADSAVSVSVCSDEYDDICSHSDPYACFLTVSNANLEGKAAEASLEYLFQHIPKRKRTKLNRPGHHHNQHQIMSLGTAAAATTSQQEMQEDYMSYFPSNLRATVSGIFGESIESEFTLVIRKTLTNTDLSKSHSRFSIPITQIANEFLRAGEKSQLYADGNIEIGPFLDPDMAMSDSDEVAFKRWWQKRGFIYNISGEAWRKVVEKKHLAAGDVVELWCFRNSVGKLCFTLLTMQGRLAAVAAEKKQQQQVMMNEYIASSSRSSTLTREEERPLQMMSTSCYPDVDLTLKL